jgi:hypothetical protein
VPSFHSTMAPSRKGNSFTVRMVKAAQGESENWSYHTCEAGNLIGINKHKIADALEEIDVKNDIHGFDKRLRYATKGAFDLIYYHETPYCRAFIIPQSMFKDHDVLILHKKSDSPGKGVRTGTRSAHVEHTDLEIEQANKASPKETETETKTSSTTPPPPSLSVLQVQFDLQYTQMTTTN